MNGPDRNTLFVRTLLQSAKGDRPRAGARARCIARLSAPHAAIDVRRVGSVVLAAALAAALGLGSRWTPAPAGGAGSCAAGGEAQVDRCGDDRGSAVGGGFIASSGSSGGGWSGSSSG